MEAWEEVRPIVAPFPKNPIACSRSQLNRSGYSKQFILSGYILSSVDKVGLNFAPSSLSSWPSDEFDQNLHIS